MLFSAVRVSSLATEGSLPDCLLEVLDFYGFLGVELCNIGATSRIRAYAQAGGGELFLPMTVSVLN